MLQEGAVETAPSSQVHHPEVSATVSCGSAVDHSVPVSVSVSISAVEASASAKSSPHREPRSSSTNSPKELRRSKRCYEGAKPCEVFSTPPMHEAVIDEEKKLSLLHARLACSSDMQLRATQAVCTCMPAPNEHMEIVPLLTSQSPVESLYSSNPAAAASIPTLDDPSKITMASVSSLSLNADSSMDSELHLRTNSLVYYSPHIHHDASVESLETDAALHRSHAVISSPISCLHASSVVAPRARVSSPLSSQARQSMTLTKLRVESPCGEGSRSSSPTVMPGDASCIISDTFAPTPEKPDRLPLRTLTSEEGACVPPLSTPTTTQHTVPPITTTQVAKQAVNAKGGVIPTVPAISLPVARSAPISDSERSLASIPVLGYGPRSTPNACSLASARSCRSARSARHSNRYSSTLRNDVPDLKELFPTLPEELYIARDRLCISHDRKRRLGSGAYGIVQQAELYPPGVEVPRIFTPTTESLASASIASTPRFSPANGCVSTHSFSSIAAAVGVSENVGGVSNSDHCGAEQTSGPGTIVPVTETSGHTHLGAVSMFSSNSITPAELPLHQQPYNEQTALFYNSLGPGVRWSSAVEFVKDPSWARAPSLSDGPTPNVTAVQSTVLSAPSASHETPVFGAVSPASPATPASTPLSPFFDRPLRRETTAVTPMDFSGQMQGDLQLPAGLELRLGQTAGLCADSLTSSPVLPGHPRGSDHSAATAADNTGDSTVRTSICAEGRDCPTSVLVSARPARAEGEAAEGETEPDMECTMTSSTGRQTLESPLSPIEKGCTYRSSIMRVGHRVASEHEDESERSGPRTYASFTPPTTRCDSLDTALTAATEGRQTSRCETVVPPVTVDVSLHCTLSRTPNLVSSKLVNDVDAADHTAQAVAMVGADTNDKAQVEGYCCPPNVLPCAVVKESSCIDAPPAVVAPAQVIYIRPSDPLGTVERCATELTTVGDREEGKEDELAEKTSAGLESQGTEARRQGIQESREVSGASFLMRVSCPELQLTCDGAGDEMLAPTAQQAIKRTVQAAREEHRRTVNQTEEIEKQPGAGLFLRRRGHGSSSARLVVQDEARSDGEGATAISTDVVVTAAAQKAERVTQRFTHLSTGTPTLTSAPTAKGTNTGFFDPLTHVRGGAGASETLGGQVAPSSISSSLISGSTILTGAAATTSTVSATSTLRPGSLGGVLLSSGITNPLQSSFDFSRNPIARYGVNSSMMSDALSNGTVPFRSVATKVIEKMDLARNTMKLNAFHNELRMASRLHHPCLVNIFGVAEDAANFYLVMDLAEKGNLAQYQEQFGVGATREMAPRFMADVVLALEYLRDGSQHSYWMTPSHDSAGDILLHDRSRSTSRKVGIRGATGAASTMEPHGFPDSTCLHSSYQDSERTAAAAAPKGLALCASTTPLPSQHTGETEGTGDIGEDMCSSASVLGLAWQESLCEPSELPSRTSSIAFGHELPAPPHALTFPRQQSDTGGFLALQDSIIVHRDLKPENLLLTWDFHVKLADFGDACFYGDDEANDFGGTPSYISPEVVARCKASPYSDLWALGCVLYELLVGERLFSGSLVEVGNAVQKFKPESLVFPDLLMSTTANSSGAEGKGAQGRGSGAGAAISEAAKDLVRQLLQPVPEERLGSAERGGFDALKAHSFFAEINWEKVLQTTNMTTTNTNYTAELAEYLEPAEMMVYCSPVKLLPNVEGGSCKEYLSGKGSSTNSRNTQGMLVMVLTDAPRLFLVNPDLDMVQLEIPWSMELHVRVLRAECFTITVPVSDALRSLLTPAPESPLSPKMTSGTNPMLSSSSFSAATASMITCTFFDFNRRADLWGVKIHHLQSMCSERPAPGSAARASLSRHYSPPAIPMAGEGSHFPLFVASSPPQPQNQKCRGTFTPSPHSGSGCLQPLRGTPCTMRTGSLGNMTISSSEHNIGAPRSCAELSSYACGGALSARITPVARARFSPSAHCSSVSPSSAFTVSNSAAAATPGASSVMLRSSDLIQPPSCIGAALPSRQRRSNIVTVTIASSIANDPPRGFLHTSKVNVGSTESTSGPKSPLDFGCTKTEMWVGHATPPALCNTTNTSANTTANTTGASTTSTIVIPVCYEDSPQSDVNLSATRWSGCLPTPATSVCTSAEVLHSLGLSAATTFVAGSVPEMVLRLCSSGDAATPPLACCSRSECSEGDSLLTNSFEGANETQSPSEDTPGPLSTPRQVSGATGTPAGLWSPSLCRENAEGGTVSSGAPITPLRETTSTAAAAKLPIKTSQARQQYQLTQKMKSKP
ncbi:Protein kinase domain/Protein tyrosine kinase, putative [Leishmania lindenbergi]|uniref:non-specific serine/threonine protein kinase n=1 Tax=Leishmania lindenbergi TaxID=651832 RepID=A0AAW3A3D4_9TRYP